MQNAESSHQGYGLKLVLAWTLVGIPLIWGVLKTLQNAMTLFQ